MGFYKNHRASDLTQKELVLLVVTDDCLREMTEVLKIQYQLENWDCNSHTQLFKCHPSPTHHLFLIGFGGHCTHCFWSLGSGGCVSPWGPSHLIPPFAGDPSLSRHNEPWAKQGPKGSGVGQSWARGWKLWEWLFWIIVIIQFSKYYWTFLW